MSDEYDRLISQLPDRADVIDEHLAVLEFIGEAWIDDRAHEVDDGRFTYEVPLAHLRTSDGEWAIESTASSYHVSDLLKDHENAPETVQNWPGPFTIKLRDWYVPKPQFTVDGRFTPEGLSVSAYDAYGNVVDEVWFTYAEIEHSAENEPESSDFTFELGS